jgi:NADPH2:quinone reductase
MQAVLCTAYGPPSDLTVAEVPSPMPGAGQVVISVRACGVNFPDTLVIQGKYQFQPPMPFTPGSDVAGVITSVGEGVRGIAVGDRVLAFVGFGGFAEEVACPAEIVMPLPEGVDFISAAALLMPYTTSYYALKDRAHLQAGETVLVLGAAGGVGLAAVELAHQMGAHVIAAASSPAKLEVCRQHGADAGIDYSTEDLRGRIKELTGGRGVDVVFDPVGDRFAEPALRSMAWNGRYLVIGFAAGEIPRIPLNLPLLKGCAIVGVFLGGMMTREPALAQANLRDLVALLAAGKLAPHIAATYPLTDVAAALDAVMAHQIAGKVVLLPRRS